MDPDEALKNAREAVREYLDTDTSPEESPAVIKLVNAFEALDGWLSNRGFLPAAWRKGR